MEKREAESEECLLLALLTSTTASDFITRRHETYRCTCTALLGHNTTDLKCIQQAHMACTTFVYAILCLVPRPTRKLVLVCDYTTFDPGSCRCEMGIIWNLLVVLSLGFLRFRGLRRPNSCF